MVERLREAPRIEQRTAQTPAAVAMARENTIGSSSQISLMSDMSLVVGGRKGLCISLPTQITISEDLLLLVTILLLRRHHGGEVEV